MPGSKAPPLCEAEPVPVERALEPREGRLDRPLALRPRALLNDRSADRLSQAELVAVVLGRPADPPVRMARRLLCRHGLQGLAALGPRELQSAKGVGEAGALRLAAAFELARRMLDRRPARARLNRPAQAFAQVRHLARARKEHLVGLYLDSQNGLLHRETISIGTLNTTRTHPREILYPAIVHLALGFILAHNHPSGCLEPSVEDVEFTRSVQRAAELMGVELYDHLIVGADGYTSLRERGLL
jgi:DNA repair protein RadC